MSLWRRYRRQRRDERGQVFVMVAGAMLALLGFSAIVIDIGILWNTQQQFRAMTDAAALAGAQEMQNSGSRGLNASSREEARGAAMRNVLEQLEVATMPTCPTGGAVGDADTDGKTGYAADVRNCAIPGTDYTISILTRSPLCLHCYDDERSIMVELTRANVPTTFARLFGRDGWPVRQTSVASIGYTADFAVMTLRPPANGFTATSDANADNINVQGTSTRLFVSVGDLGTNTNMVYTGGAMASIDDGYMVHHFDQYQAWGTHPRGKRLFAMIEDPNYPMPTRTGAPTFANVAAARMSDADCLVERNKVPSQYTFRGLPVNTTNVTLIQCLKPGIYNFMPEAPNGPNSMILFTPGVYFLDEGLNVFGTAIGGYEGGAPGVALVFPRDEHIESNNPEVLALNAGSSFKNCTGTAPNEVCAGTEALPAVGFDGDIISTGTGPAGNDPDLALTIMVEKDPNCVVQIPYPTACNDAANQTISLYGGGSLYLAGVQYAPTDNVHIGGGSSGAGKAGRIVAWTVLYHGNTKITQAYPGASAANGVMRLDAACSGAGANSMTNALCNP